jgi:peroxiredoxin
MTLRASRLTAPSFALMLAVSASLTSAAPGEEPLPGHSMHGEAFNEGPRQKAYLMGGTGKVHLPVTASAGAAQAFFDQGVGQLHGFWYFEAERSFRQVAFLDPDCAMAYWGMALANINNKKRAEGFMKVAVAKKAKASPREQRWLAAYADYWLGTKEEKDRRQNLVKALEDMTLDFPDELEAKAFVLYHAWDNSGKGWPFASRLAVDALIKDVLAREPMHPAHHYMIHLWDNAKPVRALASAARCGQAAPTIAHMWHMPGHTYSKVKRYADAVWQQEASARADHRHMMKDWVLPDQIHNYAHNNQWLVENLEYIGRAHDAVRLARNLIELPRHPRYNTLGVKPDGSPLDKNKRSAGEGRRRLLETLLAFELWDEIIALADTMYLEPTDIPAEQANRLRALGLAHFGKGLASTGREQIAALESMLKTLRANRVTAADSAEARAKKENKSAPDIAKAMADALQKYSERLAPVENALAELRGLDALARAEKDPLKELPADVPKDRRARYLLAAGERAQAEKTARADVAASAEQVVRLANLVDILVRCGKRNEAAKEFPRLRALACDADLDVPVMQRLAPFAKELGLPADWRHKRTTATDVGERPSLDTLGPLLWQPWQAPEWRLPASAGGERSLTDYRGKPVLIICYLGLGCAHCLEQLKTFAPLKEQFRDAGIEVVAVSTDTMSSMKESLAAGGIAKTIPFPILADPELRLFKAYRAFDDFEDRPLHGTFLIDAEGQVRWQDVGHEPFNEPTFLLQEARRLLAQAVPAGL